MINRFLITGDCHREFSRFKNYSKDIQNDPNTAIIILGDAGINWTLDEHDNQLKNFLSQRYKFRIYCVRGNHEARPQTLSTMQLIYDEDVDGEVYMESAWPNIRYFKDWGIYTIGDLKVAVIGGAYSVDKWYRLECGGIWFENEQLSDVEMLAATIELRDEEVDAIFTHTCPICWEPTDLFLSSINQSKVDKSMELFLEEIAREIDWQYWFFGHFHADRLERPEVMQIYKTTYNFNELITKQLQIDDIIKSPNFYQSDWIRGNEKCVKR